MLPSTDSSLPSLHVLQMLPAPQPSNSLPRYESYVLQSPASSATAMCSGRLHDCRGLPARSPYNASSMSTLPGGNTFAFTAGGARKSANISCAAACHEAGVARQGFPAGPSEQTLSRALLRRWGADRDRLRSLRRSRGRKARDQRRLRERAGGRLRQADAVLVQRARKQLAQRSAVAGIRALG